MKTSTISDTKNHLSALLDGVRNGESVLILDRQTPIAKIVPIDEDEPACEETRLWRLQRKGMMSPAKSRTPRSLWKEAPPSAKTGHSIVRALMDERSRAS